MKKVIWKYKVNPALPSLGLVILLLCAAALTTSAQKSAGYSDKNQILEVDVTNLPQFHEGDPGIAVNPKDYNNLVFVSTCTMPWYGNEKATVEQRHFAFAQSVYYSKDRGRTWTNVPFPFGKHAGAGVARVATDANGTFYLHYNALGALNPVDDSYATQNLNMTMLSRSTDGGRTWSEPVETPMRMAGQPKLRVDMANGKIYATGGENFLGSNALSVSADQGQTWSPITLLNIGSEIAVYGGILATAGQKNNEVLFLVSQDDGKTWKTCLVTDSKGVPAHVSDVPPSREALGPYSGNLGTMIAADPTKKGCFAVVVPRSPGDVKQGPIVIFEVYITEDVGQTWTGPSQVVTYDACRPGFDFGLTGVLGLMWRTHAVDAYAAVSFDRGKSFSRPVRVNAVTQPLADSGPMSDHWSSIAIDDEYAYVVWSDGRGGGAIDAIFGRVPFSMFKPLPPAPFSMVIPAGIPSLQPAEASQAQKTPAQPVTAVPPAVTQPAAAPATVKPECLTIDNTMKEIAADPNGRAILASYFTEAGVKAALQFMPDVTLRDAQAGNPDAISVQQLNEMSAKLNALCK